jgi:hypothetical protein
VHGSVGVGGALVLTGNDGDVARGEVAIDVEPRSRFGALVAWRGFDRGHRGLVCAGVVYEGAAARPRLVLDLHGDVGADLDLRAPVIGGGVRTVIGLVGPLGVALDAGTYLAIDGVDRTRLQLVTSAAIAARW